MSPEERSDERTQDVRLEEEGGEAIVATREGVEEADPEGAVRESGEGIVSALASDGSALNGLAWKDGGFLKPEDTWVMLHGSPHSLSRIWTQARPAVAMLRMAGIVVPITVVVVWVGTWVFRAIIAFLSGVVGV